MRSPLTARRRLTLGLSTSALVAGLLLVSGPSASAADIPTAPVAQFAATCAGTTDDAPTAAAGPVSDLTQVFGLKLAAYNAGKMVPLYDAFGGSVGAYPPLCGVRYDARVGGPVTEWMFCTDITSVVCGTTTEDGGLADDHSEGDGPVVVVPKNPLTDLEGNGKLTLDQEKLISYLVQKGHSYTGTGNQSWPGNSGFAQAGTNTADRAALQTLVWCISDAPTVASDFATTCEANMDAEEQARLLALIPTDPELTLDLPDTAETLPVGATAEFALTTNIYNQPITVTSEPAGALTVCDGDAELTGDQLTVTGTNPAASTTITLCLTGTEEGTVDVTASATPPSTTHINWAQSINDGGTPCQVYANFSTVDQFEINDAAAVTFEAVVTTTETTPTTTTETTTTTTETTATETTPTETTPTSTTTETTPTETTDTTPVTYTSTSTTPTTSTTTTGPILAATGSQIPTALPWIGLASVLAGAGVLFGTRRRSGSHH